MADLKVCGTCGQRYVNFCVACAKRSREEKVDALMERVGLTEEALVAKLAELVEAGHFGALSLAISLRGMRPATKTEVQVGGQALEDLKEARKRLAEKIERLVGHRVAKVD